MKRIAVLTLAVAALAACSEPKGKSCTGNADCPSNAICVEKVCQQGTPSGGSVGVVGGAGRMTAGTLTMDAQLGTPAVPAGNAGTKSLTPAENTR